MDLDYKNLNKIYHLGLQSDSFKSAVSDVNPVHFDPDPDPVSGWTSGCFALSVLVSIRIQEFKRIRFKTIKILYLVLKIINPDLVDVLLFLDAVFLFLDLEGQKGPDL